MKESTNSIIGRALAHSMHWLEHAGMCSCSHATLTGSMTESNELRCQQFLLLEAAPLYHLDMQKTLLQIRQNHERLVSATRDT